MATVAATLDLQSEQFLAIFDLHVTQILPTKFQVDWHFGSKEVQNRLSWCHFGFPIETILASFDLQVTLIFRNGFKSVGLSVQEKFNINLEQFQLFLSTNCTDTSYLVFESTGLLVRSKKRKIDFQDGLHGSHIGFPMERFYLFLLYILIWFGFYGPFKNISLISSRSFIEGGRKPEKNHLTIHKQNLAFPHMTRARIEPQRWET